MIVCSVPVPELMKPPGSKMKLKESPADTEHRFWDNYDLDDQESSQTYSPPWWNIFYMGLQLMLLLITSLFLKGLKGVQSASNDKILGLGIN